MLAGYIRWTDYRGREAPKAIRIFHHKTGAIVLHPLEDNDGTLFYADAESILAKLPRRGIPMILHEVRGKTAEDKPKPTKLYSASGMAKLVRRIRDEAGLPSTFTLYTQDHAGEQRVRRALLNLPLDSLPMSALPLKATFRRGCPTINLRLSDL